MITKNKKDLKSFSSLFNDFDLNRHIEDEKKEKKGKVGSLGLKME